MVRVTKEIESGSLPTPVKYDSHGTWESNNYHGLGWSAKHDLSFKVREKVVTQWPTPVKHEDRAAAYTVATSFKHFSEGSHQVHLAQPVRDARMQPKPREKFPTPVKFDSNLIGDDPGRKGAPSLKQRTRALPTPNAWDSKAWIGQNQENLAIVVKEAYEGDTDFGELSPIWTEWLMGWVEGWTGLDPIDPATFDLWLQMVTSGSTGDIALWHEDPSERTDPKTVVPRTCAKDLPARVERIAAIGNGQVSAVAAAAYIFLDSLDFPKEQP